MRLPAFFSWLARRQKPSPDPEPAPLLEIEPPAEPEPPFDAAAALRTWLADDSDLRAFYQTLQVHPNLEETCANLLARAKALLRVEIPDPIAFSDALERLAKTAESGDCEAGAEAAWAMRGRDPLLLDVLALRHDLAAVSARLDQRPVDELLPFLEEIPSRRGGEVVWRLPRELALLRRRPARFEAFLALLDELGNTLHRTTLERRSDLREALRESLARTGRDALAPAVYLPASLRSLEERLGEWLAAPSQESRERRQRLDAFLRELLATRHQLSRPTRVAAPRDATEDRKNGGIDKDIDKEDGAPTRAIANARALAAELLATGWLQTEFLLPRLLHLLLLAELAALSSAGEAARPTLEACAAEVCSGYFDGVETARRLRALEPGGIFVSSLIFAVLRLIQQTANAPSFTR